jgi:hypothetical protein
MIARLEPYIFSDMEGDLIHILPLVNNLDLGTKLAGSEEGH